MRKQRQFAFLLCLTIYFAPFDKKWSNDLIRNHGVIGWAFYMYEGIVETKHRPHVLYLIGSSVVGKQKLTSGTPGCLGPWPDWSKGLPLRRCRSDSGEVPTNTRRNTTGWNSGTGTQRFLSLPIREVPVLDQGRLPPVMKSHLTRTKGEKHKTWHKWKVKLKTGYFLTNSFFFLKFTWFMIFIFDEIYNFPSAIE